MASDADLELAFYDKFLLSKGLEPYPVQEQAISHIFAGKSVLVTVPEKRARGPDGPLPDCFPAFMTV